MTREEILAMVPGKILDFYVADKVMGGVPWGPFQPSTDISAAWEVVEKIGSNAEWMLYRLGHTDEDGILKYNCTFLQVFSGFSPSAKAETAPLAICRAALLAVLETTP